LVALRWLLGSPETSLPPAARLQRQQWLLRYPQFVTLERASAELRSRLEAALPAGVFSAERLNAARPLWDEWNTLVHAQEALLAQMALERLPTAMMFPPVLSTREAQQQLPEGTLVLYYQATSRQIYRFALDKDRYGMAPPLAFGPLEETLARLLRQIGNHDRNQPVAAEDLRATEWQKTGAQLMAVLTDDVASDVWAPYRELVIVPDGVVWYVPWEMLPPPGDTRSAHVISRWPVRQAPSLGLALPPREAPPPLVRTGIVVGRLSPRDEESLAMAGATAIADSLGGAAVFPRDLPVPWGLVAKSLDCWIVLADQDESGPGLMGWAAPGQDGSKSTSSLADGSRLPLGRPRQVLLPGFHTPAEVGLRRPGQGEELFLACCGWMSAGCQTVLLSRWRVGGQSTLDLVREFAQELPYTPPAVAWQRSVQLAMNRPLDPAREGRLKVVRSEEALTAAHPFFWAGYVLVDRGAAPPLAQRQPSKSPEGAGAPTGSGAAPGQDRAAP
jgi:hypothetical protein